MGEGALLGTLVSFSPLVIGAIGFWFMRFWAVALLAVTSLVLALLLPPDIVWGGLIFAVFVAAPPAIIAVIYRDRFRWW